MSRIAIVGAGPAGGTLAVWLARAGLHPLLIDAERSAGGAGWRGREGDGLRRAIAQARLDYRPETEVIDIAADRRLTLLGPSGQAVTETADCIVLAPGATERPLPVPGWTLPGVLGLGALQRLLKQDGMRPAGPLALVGSGPLLRLAADQMIAAGVHLSGIVDAGRPADLRLLSGLARRPGALARGAVMEMRRRLAGVPLYHDFPVAVHGAERVESVELSDGRRLEASLVGLGFGLQSNTELARLAGLTLAWNDAWSAWLPERDEEFQSSREGIFVLGDGAGLGGLTLAEAEGICLAAGLIEKAAKPLPPGLAVARRRASRRLPSLRKAGQALAVWSQISPAALRAIPDATIICRCEGTSVGSVRNALADGYRSPAAVKLASRAGMGLCQGRTCEAGLRAIVEAAGLPPADFPPGTVRLPLRPVPASAFVRTEPDSPEQGHRSA
ncbi:NAD(P)/FAD-dependent oxidoreductase [Telmatospirillum siberiense]|nr:FAD/NAD(P)-binding oxidoreductase [Telmatospirillum siberiense]